jgi:hypothetical protein
MFIKNKIDIPLLIISILLVTTLFIFLAGIFPYPFGLIVLTALGIARLLQIQNKK